jgi:hypothetical protein
LTRVAGLSQGILRELLSEFVTQKRGVMDLTHEYAGVPMPMLKEAVCGDSACDVDFDLAMQDLVKDDLVGTGPMVPFDNPPDSGIILIGLRSKNEYAYLKEKGYKAAQKASGTQRPTRAASRVHISGGTFNQSPIGIGEQVTQSVTMTLSNAPVFTDLRNAVLESNIESAPRAELLARIEAMEDAHKTGGFVQRYQDFITCAANHMTLIAPFLPALAALLK